MFQNLLSEKSPLMLARIYIVLIPTTWMLLPLDTGAFRMLYTVSQLKAIRYQYSSLLYVVGLPRALNLLYHNSLIRNNNIVIQMVGPN